MKTDKETNNSNNVIGNLLAGAFLILVIAGVNAFIKYDGVGYAKTAWSDLFGIKNSSLVNIPTPTPKQKADCQRVWSISQKKYISICKTRSGALADCSKNSREKLTESGGQLKNVNDLEKFRELLMRMCMQEYGFDY